MQYVQIFKKPRLEKSTHSFLPVPPGPIGIPSGRAIMHCHYPTRGAFTSPAPNPSEITKFNNSVKKRSPLSYAIRVGETGPSDKNGGAAKSKLNSE